MIYVAVEQGSPEWERLRLGIPTASAFDNIITPKKLLPSSSATKYRDRLLAEWMLGHPIDWTGSAQFMERGKEFEPQARRFYEMYHDVDVQPGGFVFRDDRCVGGSPDGLVEEDGGVEIKCPGVNVHVGYLLRPETLADDYLCQVQGLLYLTGRAWWDMVSYHPEIPPVVHRVERDERFIGALGPILDGFIKDLEAAKQTLESARAGRAA